jgi:hypothetical protein
MPDERFTVAVFPFLKTSAPVAIGGALFRSTKDLSGLTQAQAAAVAEIAGMLFSNDSHRIDVALYAVVPFVDLEKGTGDTTGLQDVQAVVTYLYLSPHPTSGRPFLSPDHAIMILFNPGREIPLVLVQPRHNTTDVGGPTLPIADERGMVTGYTALYDFRHHFWVVSGSRVYGPWPRMTLNISQDLDRDFSAATQSLTLSFLPHLLDRPETQSRARVFTALRWFNSAHREAIDDFAAVVHLAIAFEALLQLPKEDKTDRLVESIALLLGRVPRLDTWARQFYDARSKIVHEGHAEQLRFVTTDGRSRTNEVPYQPLLAYGRQIFRLCLAALIFGDRLAEEAGLEERLVTNRERFDKLCKALDSKGVDACEALRQAAPIVEAIERYQFVSESGVSIDSLIGAVRLAAKALLACDPSLTEPLRKSLEQVVVAPKSPDQFEVLDAVGQLARALPESSSPEGTEALETVRVLVKTVWLFVFMHYYWLKERRSGPSI